MNIHTLFSENKILKLLFLGYPYLVRKNQRSKRINEIIMSLPSGPEIDKENFNKDITNVLRDIQQSFEKIKNETV